VDREQARILYYGTAGVLGLFVAADPLPEPWQLIAVLVVGIAATLIRSRLLRAAPWSRTDVLWIAVFFAAWAPAAWLLHRWPFR